jgi:peptidoglycan hydrolase-like protein with peptidoglycan-binding domain
MAEPLLRRGSSGTAVRQLQEALKEAGHDPGPVDGEFGPATEAAVRAFQQEKEIAADGVVGDITWLNLDEDAVFSHPVVRRGSTGLAVRRVQKRLTLAGYDAGGVDGIFGAGTEAGVKALQRDSGLTQDGVVGPQTWNAIDALGD